MSTHPKSATHIHLRRPFRAGSILLPLTAGLAMTAALAWMGAEAFHSASGSATSSTLPAKKKAQPRSPDPLTNGELAVSLTRLGLAADPLIAAGASAQEIASLVGNARTYLGEHIQEVRDADVNWGNARGQVDTLTRLVQGGHGEQAQALAAAKEAFNTVDAARRATLQAVFDASVNGLDSAKVQTVQTMRVNAVLWDQPQQYLATNELTEPARVELRDALANARIAAAQGAEPDPTAQQFLQGINANPAVAAAAANLANPAELRAAWQAAVFPH